MKSYIQKANCIWPPSHCNGDFWPEFKHWPVSISYPGKTKQWDKCKWLWNFLTLPFCKLPVLSFLSWNTCSSHWLQYQCNSELLTFWVNSEVNSTRGQKEAERESDLLGFPGTEHTLRGWEVIRKLRYLTIWSSYIHGDQWKPPNTKCNQVPDFKSKGILELSIQKNRERTRIKKQRKEQK